MLLRRRYDLTPVRIGNRVRIRSSNRSPYPGRLGTIASVEQSSGETTYLVHFEDGLRFRYRAAEFVRTEPHESFIERAGSAAVLGALLASLVACSGPVARSEAEPAAAGSESDRAGYTEPAKELTEQVKEEPRVPEQPRTVRNPALKPSPRDLRTSPAAPSAASPKVPTVPLPAAPTVELPPVPAPVETAEVVQPESLDVVVEQPAPAPRRVTIPSGTLVGIRMIDSVDSGSDHVGQTFLASLDAPVMADGTVVFPKGTKAYVKLTKVQSAGNLKGTSELHLQLDRIVTAERTYSVESGIFARSGSAQGPRTARTAGIGAAVGAAIGAIANGGKGAVIGGMAGAGAGVGIEAATKGEQVRVDSETRLDFRLEESLEAVLPPPADNPSHP